MKLIFLILSTCLISPHLYSQLLKRGGEENTITLSNLSSIVGEDFYVSGTAPIIFPTMKVSQGAFLIDPGVDLRVSHMRFGTLDFSYSYSIFLTEIGSAPGGWANNLSKRSLNVSYAYPIWKVFSDEPVSATLTIANAYTVVPSKVLKRLSVQAGYKESYNVSLTRDVGIDALEMLATSQNSTNLFSTAGWLSQSVNSVNLGLLYERIINTNLKGETSSGESTEGRNSTILSAYSNLQVGLSSDVIPTTEVRLHYGVSSTDYILYQADPSTLPFRRIGFVAGVNYTYLNPKNRVLSSRVGFEFGIAPGHNDSFVNGTYCVLKFVGIGFGYMSKKSSEI